MFIESVFPLFIARLGIAGIETLVSNASQTPDELVTAKEIDCEVQPGLDSDSDLIWFADRGGTSYCSITRRNFIKILVYFREKERKEGGLYYEQL